MTEAVQTALIAGSSALFGGVIASVSSLLLHRADEKRALRQTCREKLEEIAGAIGDSVEWWTRLGQMREIAHVSETMPCPPARKAYNLAYLYFPELRKPIGEYADSLVSVGRCILDNWDTSSGVSAGAMAIHDPKYDQATKKMMKLRMEAESAIEAEARKHNRA